MTALIARLRAALRLISPDDITPMGVRIIGKVLDAAAAEGYPPYPVDGWPDTEELERKQIEIKAQALLAAADALENQPPLLRAQYVAALRLYAAELWRLEAGE